MVSGEQTRPGQAGPVLAWGPRAARRWAGNEARPREQPPGTGPVRGPALLRPRGPSRGRCRGRRLEAGVGALPVARPSWAVAAAPRTDPAPRAPLGGRAEAGLAAALPGTGRRGGGEARRRWPSPVSARRARPARRRFSRAGEERPRLGASRLPSRWSVCSPSVCLSAYLPFHCTKTIPGEIRES